ncbi:hypothetical protein [Enterococcus sp. AZ062]|uniref:hypothetical protein n=1 Tax=Enterococcus sp. AZ062 TaxID=2774692 RepID=UPI003F283E1F
MEDKQSKLPKTYNHIAFEITPEQIPLYKEQLRLLDIKIEEGRSRVAVDIHAGNLNDRLKRYEE